MNKDTKIQSTINYWRKRLSEIYGESHILNIALYGSQNYNIDTHKSDVDVKAIYVPSIKEAITNNNWLSKEFNDNNGQHCELKDIREMCKMYSKQNINFLETLFTEYRWDNPKYNSAHFLLKTNKEKIANYFPFYTFKSICGQGLSAIKLLEKNPTNGKILAKAIYFYLFLRKYEENYPYIKCLKVNEDETFLQYNAKKLLIDLKLNNPNLIGFENSLIIKMLYRTFEDNLANPPKEDKNDAILKLLKEEIPLTAINEYEEIKNLN